MSTETACAIACESLVEGELVQRVVSDEWPHVVLRARQPSVDPPLAADRPSILLLAFKELEKAEQYYLELYRADSARALSPHRTILLCTKEEALRAYQLCRRRLFDDYVVFWPITYDPKRLLMAMYRAQEELARANGPSPGTFAAHARALGDFDTRLTAEILTGQNFVSTVRDAVQKVTADIASDRTALQRDPAAFLRPRLGALHANLAPLLNWAADLPGTLESSRQSIRTLHELAAGVAASVLVVEDDPFQRKLIAGLLSAAGYAPQTVGSGAEAMHALSRSAPDVILLDVQLPDVSGVELIARITGNALFRAVPVIMLTAHAEKRLVLSARQLGAYDFIGKPFTRATLLKKLERALLNKTVGDLSLQNGSRGVGQALGDAAGNV